ncbi:MAG: AsmA family protein [Terriglobia bacterium]
MNLFARRYARTVAVTLALLALAAWQLPTFLSAERFRKGLEAGIERTLHRSVTFRTATFRMLPRPGFALNDVVVREDPAFGPEPFARIDRIECDIRWRSIWRSRLEFATLRLERPSFNVVRNDRGEWNVEKLLVQSGVATASSKAAPAIDPPGSVDLDVEDGRLDFKVGDTKKQFAITDLRARLNLDPARGIVRYEIFGNPMRSDLAVPPPGPLEFSGEWKPGPDLGGSLRATLRTRGALVYNWVPLLVGYNPEIYGVLDADVRLSGSLRVVKVEGEGRLTQLHRWEVLPPSDPMPVTLHFRGEFDRSRGRALVESADAAFADSRLHLSGAADHIPSSPELDFVVALERARMEDLLAVGRRLWGYKGSLSISGRADGLLSIQGPWTERRYGGFLGARELRFNTPAGAFPVSDVALRIDREGARLAPVKLTFAPRVELVAMGALLLSEPARRGRPASATPRYELRIAANAVNLRDVVRLGRELGFRVAPGLDARGTGNATAVLTGSAWPLARPVLTARAELRAARLLIPGLTEPVNIPRARIQVNGDRVVVDPLTAVMGTSVFSGRLEHEGERARPWRFNVKADRLAVEQGALWFDVLGHRPPLPLLERIPGLSSLAARRTVASGIFSALNAQGRFETSALTYRSLRFDDFRADIGLSGRVFHVTGASFRVGGGRGRGKVDIDLTSAPARVGGEVNLAGAKLQTLVGKFPPALRRARGLVSGSARFETRGLSRGEMSAGLTADVSLELKGVSFGEFDPLQAVARRARWGSLEASRGEVVMPLATLALEIRDRRALFAGQQLHIEGAGLTFNGACNFDGQMDLAVRADFRNLRRHWLSLTTDESTELQRAAAFRLSGPLAQPAVQPESQVSQASR